MPNVRDTTTLAEVWVRGASSVLDTQTFAEAWWVDAARTYWATSHLNGPVSGPFTVVMFEKFAQPSFGTFKTDYQSNAGSNFLVSSAHLVISAGLLIDQGFGATGVRVSFAPPLLAPARRELWVKIDVTMFGGDFDGATDGAVLFRALSTTGSIDIHMPATTAPLNVFGVSVLGTSAQVDDHSATPVTLTEGAHTLALCISEPDATHVKAELWVDSTPGASPLATATNTKAALDGVDEIIFTIAGPFTTGRETRFSRILACAGTRASNPFGIL